MTWTMTAAMCRGRLGNYSKRVGCLERPSETSVVGSVRFAIVTCGYEQGNRD
jgi:hypothetical protein